jgi:methionine sulfoxide reductase heme-binding subunit
VLPWLDRAGRLSVLKLAVFLAVLGPGLWVAGLWATGGLGPKPVTEAIHQTGDWSLRLLVATLAVTPLRRIGAWPKLILVRRILGLAALGYALVHLSLYALDQAFDLARVASEIVLRFYLTLGFAALLGMAALGATSTDAAVRRMGPAWHRLHRAVYPIAVLALVHMTLQSKLDVTDAILWSGLFGLLIGHRGLHRAGLAEKPWALPGLAVAAALLTAGLEAGWYALATGVEAALVLAANLDFAEIRPGWWVLAAGMALSLVAAARNGARRSLGRGRRPQPQAAAA